MGNAPKKDRSSTPHSNVPYRFFRIVQPFGVPWKLAINFLEPQSSKPLKGSSSHHLVPQASRTPATGYTFVLKPFTWPQSLGSHFQSLFKVIPPIIPPKICKLDISLPVRAMGSATPCRPYQLTSLTDHSLAPRKSFTMFTKKAGAVALLQLLAVGGSLAHSGGPRLMNRGGFVNIDDLMPLKDRLVKRVVTPDGSCGVTNGYSCGTDINKCCSQYGQ